VNPDLTLLLHRASTSDPEAVRTLLPLIYDELRGLAKRQFSSQAKSHTLQATALVHEAFLKMIGSGSSFKDRAHFFAIAATAMRQILVNHARDRAAQKRGGGEKPANLSESLTGVDAGPDVDILDLNTALEALLQIDQRKHKIVELRFFGGLSVPEVAEAMGISVSTVEAEWRACRAWLSVRLDVRLGER
jgi:RNA polymerase sigma-70 factor, ECF subfamily